MTEGFFGIVFGPIVVRLWARKEPKKNRINRIRKKKGIAFRPLILHFYSLFM